MSGNTLALPIQQAENSHTNKDVRQYTSTSHIVGREQPHKQRCQAIHQHFQYSRQRIATQTKMSGNTLALPIQQAENSHTNKDVRQYTSTSHIVGREQPHKQRCQAIHQHFPYSRQRIATQTKMSGNTLALPIQQAENSHTNKDVRQYTSTSHIVGREQPHKQRCQAIHQHFPYSRQRIATQTKMSGNTLALPIQQVENSHTNKDVRQYTSTSIQQAENSHTNKDVRQYTSTSQYSRQRIATQTKMSGNTLALPYSRQRIATQTKMSGNTLALPIQQAENSHTNKDVRQYTSTSIQQAENSHTNKDVRQYTSTSHIVGREQPHKQRCQAIHQHFHIVGREQPHKQRCQAIHQHFPYSRQRIATQTKMSGNTLALPYSRQRIATQTKMSGNTLALLIQQAENSHTNKDVRQYTSTSHIVGREQPHKQRCQAIHQHFPYSRQRIATLTKMSGNTLALPVQQAENSHTNKDVRQYTSTSIQQAENSHTNKDVRQYTSTSHIVGREQPHKQRCQAIHQHFPYSRQRIATQTKMSGNTLALPIQQAENSHTNKDVRQYTSTSIQQAENSHTNKDVRQYTSTSHIVGREQPHKQRCQAIHQHFPYSRQRIATQTKMSGNTLALPVQQVENSHTNKDVRQYTSTSHIVGREQPHKQRCQAIHQHFHIVGREQPHKQRCQAIHQHFPYSRQRIATQTKMSGNTLALPIQQAENSHTNKDVRQYTSTSSIVGREQPHKQRCQAIHQHFPYSRQRIATQTKMSGNTLALPIQQAENSHTNKDVRQYTSTSHIVGREQPHKQRCQAIHQHFPVQQAENSHTNKDVRQYTSTSHIVGREQPHKQRCQAIHQHFPYSRQRIATQTKMSGNTLALPIQQVENSHTNKDVRQYTSTSHIVGREQPHKQRCQAIHQHFHIVGREQPHKQRCQAIHQHFPYSRQRIATQTKMSGNTLALPVQQAENSHTNKDVRQYTSTSRIVGREQPHKQRCQAIHQHFQYSRQRIATQTKMSGNTLALPVQQAENSHTNKDVRQYTSTSHIVGREQPHKQRCQAIHQHFPYSRQRIATQTKMSGNTLALPVQQAENSHTNKDVRQYTSTSSIVGREQPHKQRCQAIHQHFQYWTDPYLKMWTKPLPPLKLISQLKLTLTAKSQNAGSNRYNL